MLLCGHAWTQTITLQQPASVTVSREAGQAYILEQQTRRLLRWDGKETKTVVEDLQSEPVALENAALLTFHDGNKVTIAGSGGETFRLATFRVGIENPTEFIEGLSRQIDLGTASDLAGIASSSAAIYLGTNTSEGGTLWRVEVTTSSLGQPKRIMSFPDRFVTAATFSPQRHVVVAVQSPEQAASLVFCQAETGQELLRVDADVRDLSSLSYSASGALYAACTKAEQRGIYRLDVYFDGARQAIRAIEVARLEGVTHISCLDAGECIAVASDPEDGRAVRLTLTK